MAVHVHIIFMLIATLLSWFGWTLVIANVNPFTTAWWGFGLFYSTLFLSLFGSFAVLGYAARSIFRMKRVTTRTKLFTSFRQAFFWSTALTIGLALQGQRVLTWWIFLLVLLVFILLEFIIVSLHTRVED